MMGSQQGDQQVNTKLKKLHSIFDDKIAIMLHSGKWKKLQAQYLFLYSSNINAKTIDLYANKEPLIIKNICYPQMANLTHLNLNNNKITTIEGFSHFKTPNLKVLRLGDNDVIKIKQLTKLYAPQLVELSFYANRIIDLQPLSFTNFPQLKVLILGLNAISNFREINKCGWALIQKISLESNRRCCRLDLLITKWNHQPQIVYG